MSAPEPRYVLGPDIDLDVEVILDSRGKRITEADAQQLAEKVLRRPGQTVEQCGPGA